MNKPTRCIDPVIKYCQGCQYVCVKYPDWVETYEDLDGCCFESGYIYGFENTEPTIEFIRERNRMCATYTPKRCEGCPADNYGGCGVTCIMIDKIDAERLAHIVEKWSSEHPRKTRQSVFMEQYPNASVVGDTGTPCVYPCYIEQGMKDVNYCKSLSCYDCRREFWMQEVE